MRTALLLTLPWLIIPMLLFASSDLDNVTLQLQWRHQFQFAGYYIAKEKGFYKEVGLEVAIKEADRNLNVVDEVVSGRSEYGVGRSSLIIDRVHGRAVVMLGAVFQTSPITLLIKESADIHALSDLRGKRVMLAGDVITSAPIIAMLASQGITMNDITLQEHSFELKDLLNGTTDAMSSYISNEPFLMEHRGIGYRVFMPSEYDFDFYSDIFFTNEKELKKHPMRVRAFYEATIKGWKYAFAHIPETAKLIHEKYNTQKKSIDALLYEGKTLKKLAYADGTPLGQIDPKRIQGIADIYRVLGYYKAGYSLKGLIYNVHTAKNGTLFLSDAERLWLKAHPVLRVGIDREWAPFEFIDKDGRYQGMAAEYIDLIGKRLGVTFAIEHSHKWHDIVQMMKRRELDLYSCVVSTPKRRRYMDFTTPYVTGFPMVIITRDETRFIRDLSELDGKRVTVGKGYAAHELLKTHYPRIDLIPVDTVQEALNSVAFDQAYAFVGNIATAGYYIKKAGLSNLKVAGEAPYRFEMSMAGRNDWPMLSVLLQKALDSISLEERNAIYNRWMAVGYEHEFDYTLLWKVVVGFALIFLVFYYRHWLTVKKKLALKREVDKKVDELREKDAMLLQSSRMAEMGEMIGVISHQLKQPLCAIGANIDNLSYSFMRKKLDNETVNSFKEEGWQYINFMSDTIEDYRNFYKPAKEQKPFEVNHAINKMVSMLSAHFYHNKISFSFQATQKEIWVFGRENELQHVVLNLANNSRDALIQHQVQTPQIIIVLTQEENNARITVTDNGGGIPQDVIGTIFEPYFSTKGDEGTGIGLYMAKKIIVENFKGTLDVQNENDGACFITTIPLYKVD